jgi:protein TonB
MEAKKSPQANLEKSRKSFLLIGVAVSTSMVLMAFEWSSVNYKNNLTSNAEEVPYDIPFSDNVEVEVLKPKMPENSKPIERNNEIIEVTEETDLEIEKIIDEDEKDILEDIPDLTFKNPNDNEPYDNVIPKEDLDDPNEILEFGPDIRVPFYNYCKDDSYNEKIQCISNEIHKSIGKGLRNITSYQIEECKKPKMYVKFVINKEGLIEGLEIAGEEFYNKEIVKMVKKSMLNVPQMNPAIKNGKPVNVYFSIPINFQIQ